MISPLKLEFGRFRSGPDGPTEEPSTTFRGYELVRITDREAASSTLYEAFVVSTGERVRVSVCPMPEEPRLRRRVRRLAKRRASVAHPAVLPVREVFEESGHLYTVSEWTEAPTLAGRLETGPLEPQEAVELLSQVAEGLEAIEAAGVAEGLLSPVAIQLRGPGRAVLTELGSAAYLCELVQPWAHPYARYFAPELGEADHLGARTTVHALGCILFESLAGKPPYEGSWITLSEYHAEAIPALSERRPELGREIDDVIAQALETDPEERFSSPSELMRAAATALGVDGDAEHEEKRHVVPAFDTSSELDVDDTEDDRRLEADAEAAALREAEEAARLEAEATALREAEEEALREAEEAARREAEAGALREAEEAARLDAEATALREADVARREAEARALLEAEAEAKLQAELIEQQEAQRAAAVAAAAEREARALERRSTSRSRQADERRTAERRARAEQRREVATEKRKAGTAKRREAAVAQRATRRRPQSKAKTTRPRTEVTAPAAPTHKEAPGTARRPRASTRAVLLGCAILGLVALGGYVAGAASDSAETPVIATAGAVSVELPSAWERRPPSRVVPEVRLETALAAGPRGSEESGMVVWTTPAAGVLPAGVPQGGRGPTEAVRVGRFEAVRDRRTAAGKEVVTYSVPTTGGSVIVACHAVLPSPAALDDCERVASTLRLARLRAVSLEAVTAEDRRLAGVLGRLAARRSADRLILSNAQDPAGQTYRANLIRVAYGDARRSLEAMPAAGATGRREEMKRGLQRVEDSYRSLVSAIDRRAPAGYDSARRQVDRAEAEFARMLTRRPR